MCYILCHIQRTPAGAEVDVEQELKCAIFCATYSVLQREQRELR